MSEPKNPLRKWRGGRSFCTAASLLHLSPFGYWALEKYPWDSPVNSDDIIRISQVTRIPLPVLVDWLTANPKEV